VKKASFNTELKTSDKLPIVQLTNEKMLTANLTKINDYLLYKQCAKFFRRIKAKTVN